MGAAPGHHTLLQRYATRLLIVTTLPQLPQALATPSDLTVRQAGVARVCVDDKPCGSGVLARPQTLERAQRECHTPRTHHLLALPRRSRCRGRSPRLRQSRCWVRGSHRRTAAAQRSRWTVSHLPVPAPPGLGSTSSPVHTHKRRWGHHRGTRSCQHWYQHRHHRSRHPRSLTQSHAPRTHLLPRATGAPHGYTLAAVGDVGAGPGMAWARTQVGAAG